MMERVLQGDECSESWGRTGKILSTGRRAVAAQLI